jgi:hypothetical protein
MLQGSFQVHSREVCKFVLTNNAAENIYEETYCKATTPKTEMGRLHEDGS